MWSTLQIRTRKISDTGIELLRIWLGIIMIKHSYPVILENGFQEFGDWLGSMGVPLPHFMAYLAKGGEFLGGIMLATGFLTRLGALLVFINMVVAITLVNGSAIFSKAELPFDYLLIAMAVFLYGPGKWSLDNKIGSNR